MNNTYDTKNVVIVILVVIVVILLWLYYGCKNKNNAQISEGMMGMDRIADLGAQIRQRIMHGQEPILNAGEQPNTQDLVNLKPKNKQDIIKLYYADWCPHCVEFKPAWNSFAQWVNTTRKNLMAVSVDCSKGTPVEGIKGFPTIRLEKANGEIIEYNGSRAPADLQKFVGYY